MNFPAKLLFHSVTLSNLAVGEFLDGIEGIIR